MPAGWLCGIFCRYSQMQFCSPLVVFRPAEINFGKIESPRADIQMDDLRIIATVEFIMPECAVAGRSECRHQVIFKDIFNTTHIGESLYRSEIYQLMLAGRCRIPNSKMCLHFAPGVCFPVHPESYRKYSWHGKQFGENVPGTEKNKV
jgi:hypothetical protein